MPCLPKPMLLIASLAMIAASVLTCSTAFAAEARHPTLVIAIHVRPADRPALRRALERDQAVKLKRWEAQGLLADYRLLLARYADTGVWDAMELLTFPDEAALSNWREIERDSPGGLSGQALGLVTAIETTPSELVRAGGSAGGHSSILVIPYVALVPPAEYLHYLDGYTIPQFDGWIREGVLDGYEIVTSRFPAGRAWNAQIILLYRDDAALSRRDEVVAKVRGELALDPAWKAISDNKKSMRSEGTLALADQIAASSDAP